ncbi:hypothetical protein KXS11_03295 [Plantibacter flavus]|uniref:Tad domain-containing protein n=1 Tax=Plantibacter flavus TaxID=150123 RepID=UPI003F17E5E3
MSAGLRRRCRVDAAAEDGSTILLSIGFAAVTLALVFVGTAATSLYVEHKRLFSLADSLAAIAAESFSVSDVARQPDGSFAPLLDDDRVRESAAQALAANGAGTLHGVAIDEASSEDGRSAEVALSADWRPPFVTLFVPDGVRIEVTARARSVFW